MSDRSFLAPVDAPAGAPSSEERPGERGSLVRRMARICLGCFICYWIVVETFDLIPMFNDVAQVRPASGIGPVLGLYFGAPGILGCSLANLVSDILHEGTDAWTLFHYFIVQLIYNGAMYVAWYLAKWRSRKPYPRLESAGDILLYIVYAVVNGLLVMPLFASLTSVHVDEGTLFVYTLNNIWMLLYLGIPLLYLLERSRLNPIAPMLIRARRPYVRRTYTTLTQRLSISFIAIAALVVLAISAGLTMFFERVSNFKSGELIILVYSLALLISIPVFIVLLAVIAFLERSLTRPVEVLVDDQRTFISRMKQDLKRNVDSMAIDVDEHGVNPRYELRELYDSTNQMRHDMVDFVEHLHRITVEREHAAAELNVARQIQLGSVPHDFTAFNQRFGLDIGGVIRPAREVGGDFYDVFDVDSHDVAFVIGDVSGKGVPAALFMMRAQSLIRQHVMENRDLGTALTLVNRRLCERNDAMLFVTAFICVLDTSTGEVRYVNAGHNPPVLEQSGKRSFLSCKPGLVLGAMDTMTYRQGTLALQGGDGIMLYTDGITEACDPDDALFGEDRLLETLNADDAPNEQKRLDDVVTAVDAFARTAPQADDITMLAFRWPLPVQRLEVMPEKENLDKVFAFLEPLCEREGCTPRMVHSLMLVCEELFVNVCMYGFPQGPKLPVIFECTMDDANRRMSLAVTDSGVAYNPLSYEPEKVGLDKDHRIGGLGILLVRDNVDEISYERVDGKNILHIGKRYV
ncbi:SpoIIE family protein phosphatase [Bifidobacterium sp. 64T4]|uniref:SpoIIE family protein phosphatase n=1 Tax=Bifidobacterium pongonis TaxID=2834432 RepID=UPI001C5887AC|nr:SpoIIE family protein phosphatase [Bifidobacterium pongonis]MBW3094228.1 SpoIIE family protein phosphatase [Bifidobacterium pongonis]